MSTQSVSSYNLGYDPYLAQRINQAVSAAQSGMSYSPVLQSPIFPSTTTTTSTAQTSTDTAERIAEYQRQIAEITRQQEEAQKGIKEIKNGQEVQIQSDGYVAEDGQNDGKISLGKILKNVGNGILKTFTGMFTDENGKFSLKKTLKSVAIGAACTALSLACPPVGAALIAVGIGTGAVGLYKNAKKVKNATTDQEAEQAWQGIGTSGTVLALSLAAVKAKGVKANGGTKQGFFKDFKSGFKEMGGELKSGWTSVKTAGSKVFSKDTWKNLKDTSIKESVRKACSKLKGDSIKTTAKDALSAAKEAISKPYQKFKTANPTTFDKVWAVATSPKYLKYIVTNPEVSTAVAGTTAVSYATSPTQTLATEDPEISAAKNQQYQQQLAAQKQALEQQYNALVQGQAQGTTSDTTQLGSADQILQNWIMTHRV